MKAAFVLAFVIIFAICFVFDPTPTVTDDMTDKTIERYLYGTVSLDNDGDDNKYKNIQKRIVDANHYCPKCKSHSLSFVGLDTAQGKRIQLIDCNDCNFEMQEIWSLPNWFWFKSFSPDNHWTSDRWNMGIV